MSPEGNVFQWLSIATQQQLGVNQYFNSSRLYGGVPPWIQRPDEWRDFDANGVVAIPAVGVEVSVVEYLVPLGEDGVIKGFHVFYGASDFNDGDLIFRMYCNDRPVRNYQNIRQNLGSGQIPRPLEFRIYSGNLVKLTVNHAVDPVLTGKLVTGSIKGYTYSVSET